MTQADANVEMKPCPFCGGGVKLWDELQDSRGGATEFDVYCEHCDISTPGGHTHATAQHAIAAWNTRVEPTLHPLPSEEMIEHILRYGGRCRDCADNFGTREHNKLPCDPDDARKAIRHVLEAREHFVSYTAMQRSTPTAPVQEWEGPSYEYGVTWGPVQGDDAETLHDVVMLSSICGQHHDEGCLSCQSAKASNDQRLSGDNNAALVEALKEMTALVEESLYHLRLDEAARAYHERAIAGLASITSTDADGGRRG